MFWYSDDRDPPHAMMKPMGEQSNKRTLPKHATFATPLTQIMGDKAKLIIKDNSYNLMENSFTTLAPGPSIYSCDPMLFESLITRTPIINPQPLLMSPTRSSGKKLRAMFDAAASQDRTLLSN